MDEEAVVWRGIRVLGTPVGHPDFIRHFLQKKSDVHSRLFERIPSVGDLQAAWLLLLYCAAAKPNFLLRTVSPAFTSAYAAQHDFQMWRCLSRVLGISAHTVPESAKVLASLPLWKGGLGLRNMSRVRCAAHWSSWADCLPMVQKRHPHICRWIVGALTRHEPLPFVHAVLACEREVRVAGLEAPPWHELTREVLVVVDNESEPNQPRRWQKKAAGAVDNKFFSEEFWPALSGQERALIRSQTGPLAAMPFVALPTNSFSRFDPQPFRVLLLRRLHLPLPLSARLCRCGRPLDPCGHHRSACAVAGVLGRRGFPLESAAARVCREAGARVRTNVMVRDMDLLPAAALDGRRLEVVADGLTLHRGAQLAIDTTLVAVLKRDGTPRTGADRTNGVALASARQRKERTYPELSGEGNRATLVVLAAEVGGRWSTEARDFLVALAAAKAREAPFLLESSVKAAWLFRWSCMLACTAARSFALSLVDGLGPGVDGAVPTLCDVLSEARYL